MNFLIEIGTEELPSQDVWSAIEQLQKKAPHLLSASVRVYGTPRRLVVKSEDFGKIEPSRLSPLVVSLIKSLRFEKTMRWLTSTKTGFSRPIRSLVVLLDDQLVEVEYAGVRSGKETFGPRFLSSPKIDIPEALDYLPLLEKHHVIVDQEKRQQMILDQTKTLAEEVGGKVAEDKNLLDEVVQLVEFPTSIRGEFDERYLKIPREVSIAVMKKHQRYFPVEDQKGNLLPYFVTVANQLPKNAPLIRQGNERVIDARLKDGEFFYLKDRKHKLEHFLPKLKTVTFHEKLGSVYEKSLRLEKIVPPLATLLDLGEKEQKLLLRAAKLGKADLATALVREFPALQGVIGRIYAKEDGEEELVAKAIYEHYLPRYSGDELPQTDVGQILAVADRLDTLAGFFALGLAPSGSQDPYALRRAALGLVQVLARFEKPTQLYDLFKLAGQFLTLTLSEANLGNLVEFVKERIKADLKERGTRDDIIKAILEGPLSKDVSRVYKLAKNLSTQAETPKFKEFIKAGKRVQNIVKDQKAKAEVKEELFEEDAERKLFEVYKKVKKEDDSVAHFQLTQPINQFFNDVLVMTENENVRQNRLALLAKISKMLNGRFRLSEIR